MRHTAVFKFTFGAILGATILSYQFVPRAFATAVSKAAVGGCSSGLCVTVSSKPCPTAIDGCAGYSQCVPSADGPFICTPQQYCTSPGCGGAINGGMCH